MHLDLPLSLPEPPQAYASAKPLYSVSCGKPATGTLTDPVESIAGGNNPGVICGSAQSFAEVFKDCRILWRYVSEVVETFVYPGRQACCGDIAAQNSTIHNLGEERRLRDQLLHQVRNVFLSLRCKGLFIPGSATKSDHDGLLSFRQECSLQRTEPEQLLPTPDTVAERRNARRVSALCCARCWEVSVRVARLRTLPALRPARKMNPAMATICRASST